MFKRSKKPKITTQVAITYNVWLVIFCQLINVLPLILELKWWMLLIVTACIAWQAGIAKKIIRKPSTIMVAVLSISGCVLLALNGRELGLLSTMIHLITLSYVLKAFEQRNRGDFYQITMLGLFVVVASVIFQQSIYFALAIVFIIIINLTLLMSVFSPTLTISKHLKRSGIIVVQSIPLTVFLFIVFPILSPLWEVPIAKSAKTGLSSSVEVGDIASLALSDELAFRVEFKGAVPVYNDLYWRAVVMENFNGTAWKAGLDSTEFQNRRFKENATYSTSGKLVQYQVIVSPTYRNWLYGLDVARVNQMETPTLKIVHRQDYSLYSLQPLTQNSSYSVTSYVESPMAVNITDHSERKNLALPLNSNPRLTEKAQALRKQYSNNEELINEVLATFTQESYRYTLNPPQLTNNSLDEFYFDTKAGFCEHYASSFTYIMRAAGIPARMVTGYMGGEFNPNAGYFSIYQRDAHAWSEVWLRGKGWVRVDPTAAINPERVERGLSQELLTEQATFSDSAFSLLRLSNIQIINMFRLQLEALDYEWTRWVIGYNSDKQHAFLKDIIQSFKALKHVKWLTVFYWLLGLTSLLIIWWLMRKLSHANKPIDANGIYQLLLIKLQQHGVEKPLNFTPYQLSKKISKDYPELSKEFARFTQLYTSLMYKPLTSNEYQQKFTLLKQSYQILNKQCK